MRHSSVPPFQFMACLVLAAAPAPRSDRLGREFCARRYGREETGHEVPRPEDDRCLGQDFAYLGESGQEKERPAKEEGAWPNDCPQQGCHLTI